jgi:hypothetical protein
LFQKNKCNQCGVCLNVLHVLYNSRSPLRRRDPPPRYEPSRVSRLAFPAIDTELSVCGVFVGVMVEVGPGYRPSDPGGLVAGLGDRLAVEVARWELRAACFFLYMFIGLVSTHSL